LRERKIYLFKKNFYEEFERCLKRPCKRTALSIGALLGNLEAVRLRRLLREKENAYPGSLLGPRGYLKLSLGAIWNFSKELGPPELISDCGAHMAIYKV